MIFNQIGSKQVTRSKLEFAPSWILEEAFNAEHDSNWAYAYEEVDEVGLPPDANIVTSHVVYEVKHDEGGSKKMKARICPHGNEDDEKNVIRKDSSNAQLAIVRLMLSLVTFLGFSIKTADIKGAYLQSGPITRELYVRPPREWHYTQHYSKGKIWKLRKLPYGIVEAGRQWMIAVETWMLGEGGMSRVFGVSQLFVKRNASGSIILLVVKLSDDFLIAGKEAAIDKFLRKLQRRFVVGKIVSGNHFMFGGCDIYVHSSGAISMSMDAYWRRVTKIPMTRTRRKMRSAEATATETKQFRSLAGTLLYLGKGTLPQASFVVSLMQQRIGNLLVEHLIEANEMVAELRKLTPTLTFPRAPNPTNAVLCSIYDAAHPKDRDYGQTGFFTGLLAQSGVNGKNIFHIIDWTSHKQQRVSHSAYGAEIIAASASDDRGYYYKMAINALFPNSQIKHELNVDSKGLWDTITTLHEGREYRLRQTVQRIRNSFESKELNVVRWIPGRDTLSDALKKRNPTMWKRLNDLCSGGVMAMELCSKHTVDKDTW